MNKGVANELIRGGIMSQPFVVALVLLDEMTKICRAWYVMHDVYEAMSPLKVKREQDLDWFDRDRYWRREDDDDTRYVNNYCSAKSKDDSESFQIEDLLARILNKVEGSNEVLKEMKIINHDLCISMLTRNGKVVGSHGKIDGIEIDGFAEESENEKPKEVDDVLNKVITGEMQTSNEGAASPSILAKPFPKVNPPLPQGFKKG
ncbi:hypothetical protein MTR67_034754 [Solanum verrucosum]|uniref:Uncharacterized protein n=1 Tax=Solanum verrucosum TaxID=315347 RepID=A0AAF0U947_SOLVR|nr:hypothetical protein MTR67_034754 [Solanum verrucosum]